MTEKKLKYPVLLVHGMGFKDSKIINYWGRIPKELKKMGCDIYYGGQECSADIETNAEIVKKRIEDIISKTGSEKVNIIAHSKGGLEARYLISTLKMGDKVASLTTLSTPHNGSKTVDLLLKLPQGLVKLAGFCADIWFRILGDKTPDSYKNFKSFTTDAAKRFNLENPDDENVFYQSYAFVMKNPFSDILLWFPSLIVGIVEGENDGLLTPESAEWTNFRGIYRSNGRRGISHCDEVDLRRRRLSKKEGEGVKDMVDIYKNIIIKLQEAGF